jgi:biotin carboxyl carrier protein
MRLRITVEDKVYDVDVEVLDEGATASPVAANAPTHSAAQPASQAKPAGAAPPKPSAAPSSGTDNDVNAPVAGTVFDVKVKAGDQVKTHDTLLVLEAMKMESNVPAPQDGTVEEVLVRAGDSVTAGQALVKLA